MHEKHKIIGKPERRVDAWGKVTGHAKFAADYDVGHQLFGKVLRSKYPHARIIRIDCAKAKAVPGVEAVLTAADIPGSKVFGIVIKNQAILAELSRPDSRGAGACTIPRYGLSVQALDRR